MNDEDDQLPQPADGPSALENVRRVTPTTQDVSDAADSMHEFNRLLWEIARSVFIITGMLLGISMLVLAYYAAEFLATF